MACALARMGERTVARRALTKAREGSHAPHVDDQADMDWATALTEMYLDRTDVAERLVSNAVGRWNDSHDRRQALLGRITLAQLHVQAGTVGEWSWQLGPPTRCASCGPHEPIARASTLLKLGREPKYRDLALIARRTL
jgi:hypothetical protein